jgi:thioredoxin reductase (NADPH)
MPEKQQRHARILILGAGPAGYTAAVYAARASMSPVLVAGPQPGGQLMITTDVENYPGYPRGIAGPEMMEEFREQAERFGTEVIYDVAVRVDLGRRPFEVECEDVVLTADALIIATGASATYLGLPSERRLMNKGVSACATCDGAFFRDQDVAVVGGGDTAMEEAQYLTRMCRSVHVIHRRDAFRASRIMQQRTLSNPKITVHWNRTVAEVLGGDGVSGVRLVDPRDGSGEDLAVTGLFIAIGHTPNSAIFRGQLDMDDVGYLRVAPGTTRTGIDGVFAAGDVADKHYRQAVTAAGTGCMAAIDAERWLAAQG